MSTWESTLPRFWQLKGLPGVPETLETVYSFCIQDFLYEGLVIRIPGRIPEGEPKYPEQEAWVNKILATHQINAKDVWFSRWQFASMEDAIAFEKLLWQFGAMQVWKLLQDSKERGVLIEYLFFTVTSSTAGTFSLSVVSQPQLPAINKRACRLVQNVLSKNRIPAHKKRSQNIWEFATFDDMAQFRQALKKMLSRYRGRIFSDTGEF